ncbi:MAG: thiol reductase thioredoxin, partial [Clostridia bacterium]|nr:thiol reductase thioredoxin [Clostridia bacterium]
ANMFGIQSIPTLVYFKDGKAVDNSVGYVPKEKILEMIK